jgi:hypothetical protein
MKLLTRMMVGAAGLMLAAFAHAQPPVRPDPADPRASVPPAVYVSPLRQYQPLREEPVASWRAANERVEKIGGWRAYAKEAQDTAPLAVEPAPVPRQPSPAHHGHGGHKMH